MTTDMNDNYHYPQQESDQARSERNKMVLSTGTSLPAKAYFSSRSLGLYADSYGKNPLDTNVIQAQQSRREGNVIRSPPIRNNTIPPSVDFSKRLGLYSRWMHRNLAPQTLTNAGFSYTDDEDFVRCFHCGIGLNFSDEDDPLIQHVKYSSTCPYLLEYLGDRKLAFLKSQLQSNYPEWNGRHRQDPTYAVYHHPGYQTLETRPASFLNRPPHTMQTPQLLKEALFYPRLEATGFHDKGRHRQDPAYAVYRHPGYQTLETRPASFLNWPPHTMQTPQQLKEPIFYPRLEAAGFHDKGRHRQDSANAVYRHPGYQTSESRLASFKNWPPHIKQTPLQLAEAGFYHTGHGDGVCCFACDGGLQHWEPEDDPWIEHCRLFPACPFARIQKGDYFIELIQTSIKNQLETFTENGMSLGLEELKQRDPELQDAMDGRKAVCNEMGFLPKEINEAIKELREKGTRNPSVEEIIDVMEVIKSRKMLQAVANERPAEENQRLKNQRDQNKTNCHRECMECAEPLSKCKVCGEVNRNKIRTIKIEFI